MSDLSHHERRGLKQMQSSGESHPDADLLAAFSERTLTPRERQAVMAHLAMCPSCREVVILSAPEAAASAPIIQTAKPWLWRWPVLRWGTVAASAVVIVAAISIGYRESRHAQSQRSEEQIASNIPRDASAEQADQSPATPSVGTSSGIQPPKVRYEKVPPERALEARTKEQDTQAIGGLVQVPLASTGALDQATPPAQAPALEEAQGSGALSRQRDQKSTLNAFEIKGAPVPATVPSAAPKAELSQKPNAPVSTESIDARGEAIAVTSQESQLSDKLAKQKEQSAARKMSAASPEANSIIASTHAKKDFAFAQTAQWQVTREGYLQRSNDLGKNWAQALPTSGFRAVAFIRNEVWAGGSNGLLLHSADNGNSWSRVSPRYNDIALKGDITGIQFTDTQRGSISTSAGETWTTSDGGRSWSKQ